MYCKASRWGPALPLAELEWSASKHDGARICRFVCRASCLFWAWVSLPFCLPLDDLTSNASSMWALRSTANVRSSYQQVGGFTFSYGGLSHVWGMWGELSCGFHIPQRQRCHVSRPSTLICMGDGEALTPICYPFPAGSACCAPDFLFQHLCCRLTCFLWVPKPSLAVPVSWFARFLILFLIFEGNLVLMTLIPGHTPQSRALCQKCQKHVSVETSLRTRGDVCGSQWGVPRFVNNCLLLRGS